MEARAQSEARQDLDSKLTPIRYDDIRQTAGESHVRHQINVPARHTSDHGNPSINKHQFRPSFSALDCQPVPEFQPDCISPSTANQDTEEYNDYTDDPIEFIDENLDSALDHLDDQNDTPDCTLTNLDTTRNAIASTFRGFCCEQFVFGKCMKKESTCNFDHSTKGHELCQQSFLLLAKRNLNEHANLPPYSKPAKDPTPLNRSFQPNQTQQTYRPPVITTQRPHSPPTSNRYGNK